ncbi:MAG TPA: hypothetical protein VKS82_24995 [Streptosporangiaceae bacterium]|nr:hypothetical protein [Streptosporangiaceae bacterium]
MPLTRPASTRSRVAAAVAVLVAVGALIPSLAAAGTGPDLVTGSAYLVAPANLIHGHYYESFPGYADFGLTISGALALAATGDQNPALKGIVTFLAGGGKDPHGTTVNGWTGIGTHNVIGGSLADEALLAEVVGGNPHSFGGHDLIAALDAAVCAHRHGTRCPAAGSYVNSFSVFDQALGILAQLRAGQVSAATGPIHYLERLQHPDGSFPSLIPPGRDQDVDSTAMAAMALALAPGKRAAADVAAGLAWIAGRQESNGGFPGASGESVNSAGLAIQGLTLRAARYRPQIGAALGFLAREQNSNGGFNVTAGGPGGSNIRASTQALGGAVGTSFGTLYRDLSGTHTPPPAPTPRPHHTHPGTPVPTLLIVNPAAPGTSLATPAPVPMAGAGTPPGAATSPAAHHAFTDTSSDSSVAAHLWWAAGGVAVAGAVVIGLLLLRRRRLSPAGPVARGRR